jgi:hypothetical protein
MNVANIMEVLGQQQQQGESFSTAEPSFVIYVN